MELEEVAAWQGKSAEFIVNDGGYGPVHYFGRIQAAGVGTFMIVQNDTSYPNQTYHHTEFNEIKAHNVRLKPGSVWIEEFDSFSQKDK